MSSNSFSGIDVYREILRIRMIEEAIADRYSEQEMRCPVHLSIGQEGVAVGTAAALERSDLVLSSHRAHAHYLAKGGDLTAMLAEIYGRETGTAGGRGGSMNLRDPDAGILLSIPIVSSSIPVAVGVAFAQKRANSGRVVVSYFGDAAIEEGVFHEAANFASLHQLPIVFVCENNLYSVYTNLRDRQPNRSITAVAEAHGIRAEHAHGNDAEQVYRTMQPAVERAHEGAGPSFLLFDTYRWLEHCGPSYDNDIGYRTQAEADEWMTQCPLENFRTRLMSDGTLDEAGEAQFRREISAEIEAAFVAARAAPFPDAATAADRLYA